MVSEKIAVNAEIRETQIRLGFRDGRSLPFLCECDDVLCRSVVRLTAEVYALARAAQSRRIVAEGHSYEGTIVSHGIGYVVAEA